MRKTLAVPALIMLAGMLMVICVPSARAGADSDTSRQRTEQDIIDGFKHCVFTVNAYSRINEAGQAKEDSATAGEAGEKPLWNRNVGTALPIDDEGHLLTISCVVKNAEKVTVITDTGETVPAEIVGADSAGRIAVLRIDPKYIREVPDGNSIGNVEMGSFAYFLGVVPDMEVAISRGWISAVRPDDGSLELLGPVTAGTSGTPVLDDDSHVLGILAYNIDTDEIDPGLAKYAVISYEYAYVLARYIINVARNDIGWLGVAIDPTSNGDGVLIDQIIESSPAAIAEFFPGDHIITFRGEPVSSTGHLIDMLSDTAPNDTVAVTILRGGESRTVTVTLGAHPGRAKSK